MERAKCTHCGCEFTMTPRQLKRQRSANPSKRLACSQVCAGAIGRPRKTLPACGPCPTCGEMFRSRSSRIFCSLACYTASPQRKEAAAKGSAKAAVANRERGEARREEGRRAGKYPRGERRAAKVAANTTTFTCLECGTAWEGRKWRHSKFCSHEHYRMFMAKRFDRWIAEQHDIALPQGYDEFMMQAELPCLIDGCVWSGHGLAQHVNLAHGIVANDFKRAAGFNITTGLVSPKTREALRARDHIHEAELAAPGAKDPHAIRGYQSLEGKEHRAKSRALRGSSRV